MARQYMDMSRIRVEGLMAAFPKLLSSNSKKQHTFVETDQVRYVYHPMEQTYLVLLTNKASNTIEDLGTLRLLSKVVSDTCGAMWITDDVITSNAFELIFAFDEVITFGGHRIKTSLPEIRKNLLMESQREDAHNEMQRMKEDEARAEARRKAESILKQKQAQRRGMGGLGGGGMQGFGGGFGNDGLDDVGGGGTQGFGGSGARTEEHFEKMRSNASSGGSAFPSSGSPEPASRKPRRMRKGLSIGKKKKGGRSQSALQAMAAEEGIKLDKKSESRQERRAQKQTRREEAEETQRTSRPDCDVEIAAREKITVRCSRDGGLDGMEIKGTLHITAWDEAAQLCQVRLKQGDNAAFGVQSNPNIDRKAFAKDGVLRSKATTKPFPLGQAVPAMRWRLSTKDDAFLPLTINCWPDTGDSETTVSLEYSLDNPRLSLQNVMIVIPTGTSSVPKYGTCTTSAFPEHNRDEGAVYWAIDAINAENDSGTLEFTISGGDEDAFFPISVEFESTTTFFQIAPDKGINKDKKPMKIASTAMAVCDSFVVG